MKIPLVLDRTRLLDGLLGGGLVVVVGLLPFIFIPLLANPSELPKQLFLVFGAATLAAIALLRGYMVGTFVLPTSRAYLFVLLTLLFSVLAAVFSASAYESAVGSGVTAHAALLTAGASFVLFLVTLLYASAQGGMLLLRTLLVSMGIAGAVALLAFTGGLTRFGIVQGETIVGGVAALRALTFAAVLFSTGCVMAWRGRWNVFALAVLALFLLHGVILFVPLHWLGLTVLLAAVLALHLLRFRTQMPQTTLIVPAFLFGLSFFFIFVSPAIPGVVIPTEISPSFSATANIGWQSLVAHPWTGVGQGQWEAAYVQFLPETVNASQFWNLRFISGASRLTTMAAETGIFAIAAWLSFLLLIAATGTRRLLKGSTGSLSASLPAVLLFLGLLSAALLISGSILTEVLLWIAAALVLAPAVQRMLRDTETISVEVEPASARKKTRAKMVRVTEAHAETQTIEGGTGQLVFSRQSFVGQLVLMAAVLAAVGVLVAAFWATGQVRAQTAFTEGARLLAQGEADQALPALTRAAERDPRNAETWRLISEASLLRVSQEAGALANSGNPEQALARIRSFSADALAAAEQFVSLVPQRAASHAQRAEVLEALLSLGIGDTTEELFTAWETAAARDPKNPFYVTRLAGAHVLVAGKIEEEEGASVRETHLTEAKSFAEAALVLKSDYAPARVQLATIAAMRGEPAEAITQTEAAIAAAPQDASLRFELGLLYLRDSRNAAALEQLLFAVALDPDRANARYYAALLLDEAGRKSEALAQLERLAQDNSDTAMLQQIVQNLREGKPALEGVADALSLESITAPIAKEPEQVTP